VQKSFENHINIRFPFLKRGKILIAISGGIDSVVLTHLCHKLKLNIALAHCNFNLRDNESDGDEDFVLKLAKNLDLEVFVQNFDTNLYAKEQKRSIQMAARELRYNWFYELAEQLNFNYILTAHHADDNLETFLINFTRGTGLKGLTGIPEINGKFVRPLLPFSSLNIEHFAKENNIKWRNDSSNKSAKYLRNKIRHEVIPVLKEINPSLLQSFQNTIQNLNDTADIVEESTNAVLKRAVESIDERKIVFKVSEFKKVNNPKAYLFEVFNDYGFTEWQDLVDLLDAQSGKQVLSSDYRLIKYQDFLLLTHIESKITNKEILISEEQKEVSIPIGSLFFDEVDTVLEQSSNTIYVDRDLLKFPLKLRKKQEGDMFYPLGMNGKKKLSKYFKDEKMSLIEKENTWVLCSDNDIVWVINKRADDRFKVTKSTKDILKIEFK